MAMKNIVRLMALAVALSLLALPAFAQWGPEEEKNCFTKAEGGSLTLSAQGGNGLEDSSKLQQYETFPKGVFVPCADFSWKNDKNYFIDVRGTKLGLDDQFASLVGGKKGGFQLNLGWDQNPNWQSNTARTPYTEISPGVFHVPDGMRLALQNVYVPWVPPTSSNPVGTGNAPANPTVPGFYAVEPWVTESFPIDLRYLRKTGRAGFNVPVGESLVFDADLLPGDPGRQQEHHVLRRPQLRGRHSDRLPDRQPPPERGVRQGPRLRRAPPRTSAASATTCPSWRSTTPSGSSSRTRPTAANVINDVVLLPPLDAPRQQGLPGRPHGRDHPAQAAQGHGLAVHRQHDDGHGPPAPLDQPEPRRPARPTPNPAFTIIPPYGDIAAQYDTFMGQLKLTGDPLPWLGYILSWRKFDLKDKTEAVPLQQQRPGRRARVLQLVRLHPGAPGLGLGQPAGRGPLPSPDRPAPGCAVRRGEAPLRLPFVRRREGRRVHPLRRLHLRLGDACTEPGPASTASRATRTPRRSRRRGRAPPRPTSRSATATSGAAS